MITKRGSTLMSSLFTKEGTFSVSKQILLYQCFWSRYSLTSSWRFTSDLTRRDVVQTLFKSCSFAAEQFESVMKFENSSVLIRAWQNKIASSILNSKQCKCRVPREGACLNPTSLHNSKVLLQVRLHRVTLIHSSGVSFSI